MITCVLACLHDAHTHTNYTQKTVMLCMYALLACFLHLLCTASKYLHPKKKGLCNEIWERWRAGFFFAFFCLEFSSYLFSIWQRIFVHFCFPVAITCANFACRSIVRKWTSSVPYVTARHRLHWTPRIRIPNTLATYATTMSSTIMCWARQIVWTIIVAIRWMRSINPYTAPKWATLWWTSSAANVATAPQWASASSVMPSIANAASRQCIIIVVSSRRMCTCVWMIRNVPASIFVSARISFACPSRSSAMLTICQRISTVRDANLPAACCAPRDIIPITRLAQWENWLELPKRAEHSQYSCRRKIDDIVPCS